MARQVKPLNSTQVKQAKPREKEYNLSDGLGLALRVKPGGTKQWTFNYQKPITKKRTNISFGLYPDIGLADARERRESARKLLAQGIDPKSHSDELAKDALNKASQTFRYAAELWFDLKKTQVSPDYALDCWRSLETYVLPVLGETSIHEINSTMLYDTLKPLVMEQKLETLKRVFSRVNEVMDNAVAVGLLDFNKVTSLKKAFPAPHKNHLPSIKPEELPKLLNDIEGAPIAFVTKQLLLWQLHTMVRPAEASGARWDEINLEQKLWVIPAERMKKKRLHKVPLSDEAIGILESLKPYTGSREHVFASNRLPTKSLNPSTPNVALKRMGYQGKLVAHGFRSIASTVLNECGWDRTLIEFSLAHVLGSDTEAAYNRAEYVERRRKLMDWWSDLLASGGAILKEEAIYQSVSPEV